MSTDAKDVLKMRLLPADEDAGCDRGVVVGTVVSELVDRAFSASETGTDTRVDTEDRTAPPDVTLDDVPAAGAAPSTDPAELGEERDDPLLTVVGKKVDMDHHARMVFALEKYSESQQKMWAATQSAQEAPPAPSALVEDAPPAPSAPVEHAPPLPPTALPTTGSTASLVAPKPSAEPVLPAARASAHAKPVRAAPERVKGISPMKKKMRHSIAGGALSRTGLRSGALRVQGGAMAPTASSKAMVLKKPTVENQKKAVGRARMRASTGTFKVAKPLRTGKDGATPSYLKGTSSSNTRRHRRSVSMPNGLSGRRASTSAMATATAEKPQYTWAFGKKIRINSPPKKKQPQRGTSAGPKPSLTVPTTPSFMSRETTARKKILSSEEIELARSKKQQEDLALQRKKNEKMWQQASTSDGTLGVPVTGAFGMTAKPKGLTEAVSPNFQPRPAKRPTTAPTEELEMEEIARKKKEIQKMKLLNERRWSKAQDGAHDEVHGVEPKPVTEAKTPFLRTKAKKGAKRFAARPVHSTTMRLRSYDRKSTGPVKGTFKLTEPSTPKFASDARARQKKPLTVDTEPEAYVPVAEVANNVWGGKNSRFHSKPTDSQPQLSYEAPVLTEPHTPKLSTTTRSRETHIESFEEREAREMAEMKPFKAQEFNQQIKNSIGELGVVKVARKKPTMPMSPKFQTDERISRRHSISGAAAKDRSPGSHQFRAKKVGEGVPNYVAVPVDKRPLTQFKPFNFSTETRAREQPRSPDKKSESPTKAEPFKARPIPSTLDNPSAMPQVQKKKLTVPVAPALKGMERHEEAQKQLRLKIEEERKKAQEKMVFKAKKVNEGVDLGHQGSYTLPYKPQYEVVPFKLSNDPVGAKARRQRQLAKEQEEEVENRKFKARSLPVSHAKPFQAVKVARPLTEIKEFKLLSNHRSVEHSKFDEEAKKRREAEQMKKEQAKEEAERKADSAFKEEFAANMFKALKSKEDVQKFMKIAPMKAGPSNKRLVDPRSPKLGAARRVVVSRK